MMVVFVDSSTNMNDERVFLVDQTLHEISDNFPLSLTQVNNSGSCEPLCDFFHLCYDYKCMCFNLNIKWRSHGKIRCFLLQKMIPILNYFKNK